jgi:hypothetical protein
MKINADFRLFAATNFDASKYIASPAYGVNRFMLDRIGDEKARATTIVEYQPNSYVLNNGQLSCEEEKNLYSHISISCCCCYFT